MLNINSVVSCRVYVEQLATVLVVAVVNVYEVVRQVQVFVVDRFRQLKVSIRLKIVPRQSYDEHHEVHINVHIRLSTMTNVRNRPAQHSSMLLMLIPNKFVRL